jgi:hypothetical protein
MLEDAVDGAKQVFQILGYGQFLLKGVAGRGVVLTLRSDDEKA